MPVTTRYVFIVSMDVTPEKEALFNEVYDQEHVPSLLKVPGVRAVTRLRTQPASFTIGGQEKELTGEGAPRYVARYEIDHPDVLTSAAWTEAVEQGRWPAEVRPYSGGLEAPALVAGLDDVAVVRQAVEECGGANSASAPDAVFAALADKISARPPIAAFFQAATRVR